LCLLASNFAAAHRAEKKIVKVACHSIHAQQSGNLRPVANFMQEDMNCNFPGRRAYQGIRNCELLGDIPVVRRVVFKEFAQTLTAVLAESKQFFDILVWG